MSNQESTPSRGERTRSYWNATTIAVWIFVVVEAIAIAWMLVNR